MVKRKSSYEGVPLYEWIVRAARKHGLAGATVLRGLEGFGAHSRIHTAKALRLSSDLPIVVEIVDTQSKIEAFLPRIDAAVDRRTGYSREGRDPLLSQRQTLNPPAA